jgi:hypothetical protein
MPLLRHEARRYDRGGGLHFGRCIPDTAARLEEIEGPCEILYVVYASSQEAAMQSHYDRQGWGPYWPLTGAGDSPYTDDQLAQQLKDYPDDRELRRLNGLAAEAV